MSAAPADLQPSLFDVPPLEPLTKPPTAKDNRSRSLTERFTEWHELNPHVYAAIRGLALRAKRQGFKKWSMNGAFEVLRWQYGFQTAGDEYKLNNDYRAFYARMLMANEPELAGFFETRGEDSEHCL